MSAAVYARLRVADPARWRAIARAWRRWATLAGRLADRLTADLVRLGQAWSGAAASAAAARVATLRRGLIVVRLLCWQADQTASEFAAALDRAKRLLARALAAAHRAGLTIDDDGRVRASSATLAVPQAAHLGAAATGTAASGTAASGTAASGTVPSRPTASSGAASGPAASGPARGGIPSDAANGVAAHGAAISAELSVALAIAARADEVAAERLAGIEAAVRLPPTAPGPERPACTATPAEVRRWWAALTPAERQWLLVTEPGWLAPLDGLPVADRDAANRLLLDDRRTELDQALATAAAGDRRRLRELRHGLDALADRLDDDHGPRAYLLRLDLHEEGRVVIALGDPDHADNVVTHVPGMTAELARFDGELTRAERVADRATEISPAASTSAVLWLDYDAPDFLDEAASARRAEAGAPALRRFQDGLRAAGPARQTVIGHSYGSLVVGKAAAGGFVADNVVFVGSPGVGVDSARDLTGRVWSTTSGSDVIQYAAPAPAALARDLVVGPVFPVVGLPEKDLWFGHNPSDPAFGAHTFASSPGAGHLGYWDRGSPSLETMAAITLGTAR
ncbi:alpha/beta hydrolase [Actinoplanes sp. KI2]|uniref:alpha/beta hydrolase n=1 Tax=Actinoplanes sp. KI2 TaxID=2983315 RepID=UPI0021D5A2B8|nr:alpha/beta hydrolase [Actinoplanes sp. KI2]MCU7723282.1 alpha/beta hydrolase [Actinoplanes sp. KI2]